MKRRNLTTLVLLLILLCSIIPAYAYGAEEYTTVLLEETVQPNNIKTENGFDFYEGWYAFTPKESAVYVFCGKEYQFQLIGEEEEYHLNRYQFRGEAGTTYRFLVEGLHPEGWENVGTCIIKKAVPLEEIVLNKTKVVTDSMQEHLTISCVPEEGNLQGVTWTSSKEAVAAIMRAEDTECFVAPQMTGEAVITASTADGLSASCHITVKNSKSAEKRNGIYAQGNGAVYTGEVVSYYGADDLVHSIEVTVEASGASSCYAYGPIYVTENTADATRIRVTMPEGALLELHIPTEATGNSIVAMEVMEGESYRLISEVFVADAEQFKDAGIRIQIDRSMELIVVKREQSFTDIQEDFWAADAIRFMSARGYLQGKQDGSFAPGETIMRKTVAMLLYRLEGEPEVSGTAPFSDVKQDRYHDAILWASGAGIVNGYSDGTFRPDATLSRQHFAAMLYRYAQLKAYVLDCTQGYPIFYYGDYSSVYSWARKACQWTSSTGVIAGRKVPVLAPEDAREEGWFDPQGATSRAQLAVIMQRFLEKAHDPEPEEADFGMGTYIMTRNVGDCFPVNISHDGRVWDISWKSLDPTVATVDEIGVVTVIGEGVTVITVNDGEHFDSCAIQCGTPDSDDPKSILHDLPQEKKAELSQAIAAEIAGVIQGETDLERVAKAATMINEQYVGWRFMDDQDPDYRNAYGLFVSGSANCVGTTKALGMILDCWGMDWEHENASEWDHQWCRIYDMDGQVGFGDGGVFGVAGYGDRETADWYRWDDKQDMLCEVIQRA